MGDSDEGKRLVRTSLAFTVAAPWLILFGVTVAFLSGQSMFWIVAIVGAVAISLGASFEKRDNIVTRRNWREFSQFDPINLREKSKNGAFNGTVILLAVWIPIALMALAFAALCILSGLSAFGIIAGV